MYPKELFCGWKSWISNLKEENVFRRAPVPRFWCRFCENQGHKNFVSVSCSCKAYCKVHCGSHLLDLMRWWILEYLVIEKFVLASESNLSLATGPASWKVSLEPCFSMQYGKWLRLWTWTKAFKARQPSWTRSFKWIMFQNKWVTHMELNWTLMNPFEWNLVSWSSHSFGYERDSIITQYCHLTFAVHNCLKLAWTAKRWNGFLKSCKYATNKTW